MIKLLRALRRRPFALVFSGQAISLFGDRIFQVALAWWVLEETGSAVAMGRLPRLRRRGLALYGVWMAIGLMVVLIGLPVPRAVILAAAFVIGACNSALGLIWVNTLQECVPQHLLGRVTSIDYLGSYLLLPLGYAFGGWAAEQVGTPLVFITGGVVQTGLICLGLLHPQVRSLD